MGVAVKKRNKKWYESYLPFIAKPPELQVSWLVHNCRQQKLALAELTPYLRLLLSVENVETDEELQLLLLMIDESSVSCFLEIVDIYDLPRLIKSLPTIDIPHALHALGKDIPCYEKNIQKLVDQVFYAINNRSAKVFKEIAVLPEKGGMAAHFRNNIERFQKILDDEAFLRSMYPHST